MKGVQEIKNQDGTKSYRVQVRVRGTKPISKSFRRLTDAKKWKAQTETDIRRGQYFPENEAKKRTVNDLIDRYITETFQYRRSKDAQYQWHLGENQSAKSGGKMVRRNSLDAGCGMGHVVRLLLERGYDANGVDISEDAIHHYMSDLAEQMRIRQVGLEDLPFSDRQFDLVYCSDVMEHIPIFDIEPSIQ